MSKHTSTYYTCGTDAGTISQGMTYAVAVRRARAFAEERGETVYVYDECDPEGTTETFSGKFAVMLDGVIYGVGATREAAREDAIQWLREADEADEAGDVVGISDAEYSRWAD